MTIDKAIKLMIRGSKYDYDGTPEEFCEAYDMSIEIMRKYQKIKTILDMDISYGHYVKEMRLSAISRVVHGKKQEEQFWKFLDEVDNGDDN